MTMWNWSLYSLTKRPLLVQRNSSILRTRHTRNNNRIHRFSYRPLPQSNLPLSSRRPPHLHTSSDILRDFTRSDGYKKSRAPSWIFLFPGLSLNEAHVRSLKRQAPPFSWFSLQWVKLRTEFFGRCLAVYFFLSFISENKYFVDIS